MTDGSFQSSIQRIKAASVCVQRGHAYRTVYSCAGKRRVCGRCGAAHVPPQPRVATVAPIVIGQPTCST